MKALTDIAIRNLKPSAERREIPDPGCRGLYVVMQPSGAKSFAVRFRVNGKARKLTLPPGVSLAAARKLCGDAMLEVAQGRDPAAAKQATKQAQRLAREDTFAAIAAEYNERQGSKLRSAHWRELALRRHVYPVLGDRLISEIKRSELIRLLDRIEDRSGATTANRILGIVRTIFNWHAVRSDDFRSPIVRGMAREGEQARDRVLSDAELCAIWKTAAEGRDPYAYLIRFLLLTTARRAEAAKMTWQEIEGATWTLPAIRNKTGVELVRPLSEAAERLLAETPQIVDSRYVFSVDGKHPLGGFSRRKRQFDERCGVTGWRLHDLRRTARSLLSRAGVNADHAERCLGHVIGGVRGVYDRHGFHAEMLHAFEALSAQIERIVNPPEQNVVPITTLARG
jgi:integrase